MAEATDRAHADLLDVVDIDHRPDDPIADLRFLQLGQLGRRDQPREITGQELIHQPMVAVTYQTFDVRPSDLFVHHRVPVPDYQAGVQLLGGIRVAGRG